MNLTPATCKVLYNSKDISEDVSDYLISLTYTDNVEGKSDEIELTLEDSNLLWQNAWYPEKGAILQVQIIQNGFTLNCGSFSIDEIEMQSDKGSGDTVSIRALAAMINQNTRTKRSTAHENKSLREIVNSIAADNGLKVAGTIGDISFKRITQYDKTDLGFLKDLAADYGYAFSIRDTTITFTSVYELEARPHVLTLDKTDLISWSITDKTAETYQDATVSVHAPGSNTTIRETVSVKKATPANLAEFNSMKLAIADLNNLIANYMVPAYQSNDKRKLALLPTSTGAKMRADVMMIMNTSHNDSFKSYGNSFSKYFNGYFKACNTGDFNSVRVFGQLLRKFITTAEGLLLNMLHSKTKGDTLRIKTRVENVQQGQEKAKSALHRKNTRGCEGSVSMPGNTLIVAGNNFELTGMGTLSGIKHIASSSHSLSRSGYVTTAEIKRISPISPAKHKPKVKGKESTPPVEDYDRVLTDAELNKLLDSIQ